MLLDLISKIYYKVRISRISLIQNLYVNLMKFKAQNNRFLLKATKLWKIVTGATVHGSDMQDYGGVAGDGSKLVAGLHVANNGCGGGEWWSS